MAHSTSLAALGSDCDVVAGTGWQGTRYWVAATTGAKRAVLPARHLEQPKVPKAIAQTDAHLKRVRAALAVDAALAIRFGDSQFHRGGPLVRRVEIPNDPDWMAIGWSARENFIEHLERVHPSEPDARAQWVWVPKRFAGGQLVRVKRFAGGRERVVALLAPVRTPDGVPS